MYTNFYIINFNIFWATYHLSIFLYKCIRNKSWPLHKKFKGQPRIIIWRNLVILEYPMLHTKFQDHWLFGSGEEDFLKVFTIYGYGGHLGHLNSPVSINLRVSLSHEGSIYNLTSVCPVASGQKLFDTRAFRGSDYSPATALSEEKDK